MKKNEFIDDQPMLIDTESITVSPKKEPELKKEVVEEPKIELNIEEKKEVVEEIVEDVEIVEEIVEKVPEFVEQTEEVKVSKKEKKKKESIEDKIEEKEEEVIVPKRRVLVDPIRQTYHIEKELVEKVRVYAYIERLKISEVVTIALEQFLRKANKKNK